MQSYPYDQAGNLATRVFPASLLLPRLENFGVNSLNELTNYARGAGTLAVAGTTTSPATNVTVNTTNASLYADSTFAALGFTLTNGINTYTAIAKDAYGRRNRGTYDRTGLQGGKGVCIGCRRCQAGRK